MQGSLPSPPSSSRAPSDTAITRARVKCVFYDRNDEKRRPMFHYLLALGLAQTFDSSAVSRGMRSTSTPEEWRRTARNLVGHRLWKQALTAFTKGDEPHGATHALAMLLYEEATGRDAAELSAAARHERLLRAARCFALLGSTAHAASCLRRAGEHTMAAQHYSALGRPVMAAKVLGKAAEECAVRREALQLFRATAVAWEEAGRPQRALLVRFGQRELQAEAVAMLERPVVDRAVLQAALPHLERQKRWDGALAVARRLGRNTKELDRLATRHAPDLTLAAASSTFTPGVALSHARTHRHRHRHWHMHTGIGTTRTCTCAGTGAMCVCMWHVACRHVHVGYVAAPALSTQERQAAPRQRRRQGAARGGARAVEP